MIKKTIGLGIASLIMIMMTSVPSFAGKLLLKVPVWFPTTLPALGTSPAWVAKQINAIGGDLTMKTYEPKKLVPPKEMLEAVSKGQVNAGYTTPGYNTGKLGDKGAIFSAVPFGPDAPEFLAWVYYGNGRTLWQKHMTMPVLMFNLFHVVLLRQKHLVGFQNQLKKQKI